MQKRKTPASIYFTLFISLVLALTGASCSPSSDSKKEILFFYLETCPSCEDYKMAESLSEMVLELKGKAYNVANPENGAILKTALHEKDLPDISRSLPLLLIDKAFFNGYEEIQTELIKLSQ